MTIGKPSITTPKDGSRALQGAIDNIRERLEAIEAEFNGLVIPADQSAELTSLRTQLSNLASRVTALELEADAALDALTAGSGISIEEYSLTGETNLVRISANLAAGEGVTLTEQSGNVLEIAAAGGGQCPFYIPVDESFTVQEYKQVPFAQTLEVDGELVLDGNLIEVD